MLIIRLMLALVAALTMNLLRPPASSPSTLPADPASIAPTNADVLPSVEEARKHLGNPTPGEPQIAMWISEKDPGVLFIAVRLDKTRDVKASSGGDDLKVSALGAPSELMYVAASRQPVWKRATTNVSVRYRNDEGKYTIIGPKNAKGLPQAPVWRGPEAPAAPEVVRQLAGVTRVEHVQSAALGETRTVTVYLPPGYDPTKPLPAEYKGAKPAVIYFGDGGVVESVAHIIEPMITSHRIRPVVLVGAHTSDRVVYPPGTTPPTTQESDQHSFANDPRGMEYLSPYDDDTTFAGTNLDPVHQFMFDRHFAFFADDLPRWAQDKLGVSHQREDKLISGFSNSAAFVVTLIRQRPTEYGGIVANSVAGSHPPNKKSEQAAFKDLPNGIAPPKFFFSSGTWENYFGTNTGNWNGYFKKAGAQTKRIQVVGGHDQAIWEIGLSLALPWIIPPRAG